MWFLNKGLELKIENDVLMMDGNMVDKSCQPNQNAWIRVLQYLLLYATLLMKKLCLSMNMYRITQEWT